MNHQQASAPAQPSEATPPRENSLITTAWRHPATIALIREISARVSADSERRIDLAKADLREDLARSGRLLARSDLATFGVLTTVNLLLVTVALALGRVMSAWLAALLVSTVTFIAVAALALLRSPAGRDRIRFLRRSGARRFIARLFANG